MDRQGAWNRSVEAELHRIKMKLNSIIVLAEKMERLEARVDSLARSLDTSWEAMKHLENRYPDEDLNDLKKDPRFPDV